MDIKAAAYIRISRADSDIGLKEKKDESDSVTNQRALIRRFISESAELKGSNVEEFLDDGYSGTNFNRPAFETLMGKVRRGQINCIIVKDFSRFGRSYIELGDYLEQIFPVLGVRFISINDGYDSAKRKYGEDGLDIAMKNIVYSYYARDISVKATTSMRQRQKKGRYMGGNAPYGYCIEAGDDHYSVDKEVKPIVEKIFLLACEGLSTGDITRILNTEGIESPGDYYMRKHPGCTTYKGVDGKRPWTLNAVRKIIQNEAYYGAMASHKREPVGPCSKRSRAVPKDEWYIVEGRHEPIIDKTMWLQAQNCIRKNKGRSPDKKKTYLLKGLARCGNCGRLLNHNGRANEPYFRCGVSRYAADSECYSDKISERDINSAVLSFVSMMKECSEQLERRLAGEKKDAALMAASVSERIQKVVSDLKSNEETKFRNMDALMSDQISKAEYQKRREILNAEEMELKQKMEQLQTEHSEAKISSDSEAEQFIAVMQKISCPDGITNDTLKDLIKEVRVFSTEQIEIVWRLPDEFLKLMKE